ncbi:MAG: hypothetical protein ACREL4_00165 [Gemmatimonadales bacterium]
MAMNSGRILGGGLLAGLVTNIIDGAGNVGLIGPRWQAETEAIKPGLYAAAGQSSMIGWITTDFLLGFLIIWLYAAMRPRFGPGPRTAAAAAVVIWFATRAYFSSYIFLGFFSTGLIGIASFIALVAMVAGAWAGARVYSE